MEQGKLPIRMIAPGRVFRSDEVDATHSPSFHQIEGLVVDKNITFAQGKTFCHAEQVQADDGEPDTDPGNKTDFFTDKKAEDRDNYDIHGGDKSGFANGCIDNANLLKRTGNGQKDTADNAADDQCFLVRYG